MLEEKIKQYAYVLLFISVAFNVLNVAGITNVSITVAGFDVMADITDTTNEIQNKFETSTGTLDYAMAAGFLLIMGTKILIEFLVLIFGGLIPIMDVTLGNLGIPSRIYSPIAAVMIAIALYDFAKIMLNRG